MLPKQSNSKFHKLLSMIMSLEDYSEIDNRDKMIDLVKELYLENKGLKTKLSSIAQYGIKYKTIEDDSSFSDVHKIFFITEEERDNVFSDWENELYWDELFQDSLARPTPGPNLYGLEKIIRT